MKYIMFILLIGWPFMAGAHKASDSYMNLQVVEGRVTGHWDIALRDLDFAMGLDKDDNGAITWGELRGQRVAVESYALARLQVSVRGKPCPMQIDDMLVDRHTDGGYAVLVLRAECTGLVSDQLKVDYRLFGDLDPQHRGLLSINQGERSITAVLVPGQPAREFILSAQAKDGLSQMLDYIIEGIWHIWVGFDHILFLFSLLIPSVLVYRGNNWRPVGDFKEAFWDVVKVVSAFTLAHSVTLSLAVLGYAELSSRWVESAIAASVILAALNNVMPVFTRHRPALAFVFGLIHGFGFAAVLSDLELGGASKVLALLGFNIGVEVGQLALVTGFLPVAYKLSRYRLYKPVILRFSSLGITALAGLWFLERAFDINFSV